MDSPVYDAIHSYEKEMEMERYIERENEQYDNYEWDEKHSL